MATKRNLFLIGPVGVGKTTIGKVLAQQLDMEFYDSDNEIEQSTGVDINWIFDIEGADGFQRREEKIIDSLTKKQGIVLATGGSAVNSCNVRNRLSARGIVIYLKTADDQQFTRIPSDKNRPLLRSEPDSKSVLRKLTTELTPFYSEIADVTFCVDNFSVKYIVNKLIELIN